MIVFHDYGLEQTCTLFTVAPGCTRQYQGWTTFCNPTNGSCNSVWLRGIFTGTSSTAGTCVSTGTTRFSILIGNSVPCGKTIVARALTIFKPPVFTVTSAPWIVTAWLN